MSSHIPGGAGRSKPVVLMKKSCVVFGPSGAGKTAMFNAVGELKGNRLLASYSSPKAVTKQAIAACPVLKFLQDDMEYEISFYDTRGLLDSEKSFKDSLAEWNEFLEKENITSIHQVIFMLSYSSSRLSLYHISEIKNILRHFGNLGLGPENVKLVLNCCDFFLEHKINEYIQKLRVTLGEVTELRAYQDKEIITTCFLNPADLEEGLRACATVKREQSSKKILDVICNEVQEAHFNPLFNLRKLTKKEQEEKKAEQDRKEQSRKKTWGQWFKGIFN